MRIYSLILLFPLATACGGYDRVDTDNIKILGEEDAARGDTRTTEKDGDVTTELDLEDCGSSETPDVFFRDTDMDGYGDPLYQLVTCELPSGENWALSDNDCDDADRDLNPGTLWYPDLDGDGFGAGDPAEQGCMPEEPSLVRNTDDCNDSEGEGAAYYPGMTWYADADGDGYGDETRPEVSEKCELSFAGFALNSDDCDDASVGTTPKSVWYIDADADSHADATGQGTARCTRPADSFLESELLSLGDCNDSMADVFPGATEHCGDVDFDCDGQTNDEDSSDKPSYYKDFDGDGAGYIDGVPVVACINPDPAIYVANNDDCDESEPNRFAGNIEICDSIDNDCNDLIDDADEGVSDQLSWHLDADGDGHGSGAGALIQCFSPGNDYSAETIADDDCEDSQGRNFPGNVEECDGIDNDCNDAVDESGTSATLSVFFEDKDGDGYGVTASAITTCNNPDPNLYVLYGDDCDDTVDTGAGFSPETAWYRDTDGDGYGDQNGLATGNITFSCSQPDGFIADSSDCNDEDFDQNPLSIWYRDIDSDGYGASGYAPITQCERPSNGRVLGRDLIELDTDCFDANNDVGIARNPATQWYTDADGDGYGDANIAALVQCADPKGDWTYDVEPVDCNDDPLLDGASYKPGMLWYEDADGDGFGKSDSTSVSETCLLTNPGWSQDSTDCDDTEADSYPGAPELCDNQQNDCNDGSWSYAGDDANHATFEDASGNKTNYDRRTDGTMQVITLDEPGKLQICGRSNKVWKLQLIVDSADVEIEGFPYDSTPEDDTIIDGAPLGTGDSDLSKALIHIEGDAALPADSRNAVSIKGFSIRDARKDDALINGVGATTGGAIYATQVDLAVEDIRFYTSYAAEGSDLYVVSAGDVSVKDVRNYSAIPTPASGVIASRVHAELVDYFSYDSVSFYCEGLRGTGGCMTLKQVADSDIYGSFRLVPTAENTASDDLALLSFDDSSVQMRKTSLSVDDDYDDSLDDPTLTAVRVRGGSYVRVNNSVINGFFSYDEAAPGAARTFVLGDSAEAPGMENEIEVYKFDFDYRDPLGADVAIWDGAAYTEVHFDDSDDATHTGDERINIRCSNSLDGCEAIIFE